MMMNHYPQRGDDLEGYQPATSQTSHYFVSYCVRTIVLCWCCVLYCLCIFIYVCMYVCMYVCVYVCVYIFVCMYVCMYVYVCVYVCIYACMYVCHILLYHIACILHQTATLSMPYGEGCIV